MQMVCFSRYKEKIALIISDLNIILLKKPKKTKTEQNKKTLKQKQ